MSHGQSGEFLDENGVCRVCCGGPSISRVDKDCWNAFWKDSGIGSSSESSPEKEISPSECNLCRHPIIRLLEKTKGLDELRRSDARFQPVVPSNSLQPSPPAEAEAEVLLVDPEDEGELPELRESRESREWRELRELNPLARDDFWSTNVQPLIKNETAKRPVRPKSDSAILELKMEMQRETMQEEYGPKERSGSDPTPGTDSTPSSGSRKASDLSSTEETTSSDFTVYEIHELDSFFARPDGESLGNVCGGKKIESIDPMSIFENKKSTMAINTNFKEIEVQVTTKDIVKNLGKGRYIIEYMDITKSPDLAYEVITPCKLTPIGEEEPSSSSSSSEEKSPVPSETEGNKSHPSGARPKSSSRNSRTESKTSTTKERIAKAMKYMADKIHPHGSSKK